MVKMILTYNTIACLDMMVDGKEEESATGQNTKVTLGEVGLNCIEQTLQLRLRKVSYSVYFMYGVSVTRSR